MPVNDCCCKKNDFVIAVSWPSSEGGYGRAIVVDGGRTRVWSPTVTCWDLARQRVGRELEVRSKLGQLEYLTGKGTLQEIA